MAAGLKNENGLLLQGVKTSQREPGCKATRQEGGLAPTSCSSEHLGLTKLIPSHISTQMSSLMSTFTWVRSPQTLGRACKRSVSVRSHMQMFPVDSSKHASKAGGHSCCSVSSPSRLTSFYILVSHLMHVWLKAGTKELGGQHT